MPAAEPVTDKDVVKQAAGKALCGLFGSTIESSLIIRRSLSRCILQRLGARIQTSMNPKPFNQAPAARIKSISSVQHAMVIHHDAIASVQSNMLHALHGQLL